MTPGFLDVGHEDVGLLLEVDRVKAAAMLKTRTAMSESSHFFGSSTGAAGVVAGRDMTTANKF